MSTRGSYCSFVGVLDRLAAHETTIITTQISNPGVHTRESHGSSSAGKLRLSRHVGVTSGLGATSTGTATSSTLRAHLVVLACRTMMNDALSAEQARACAVELHRVLTARAEQVGGATVSAFSGVEAPSLVFFGHPLG